MKKTYFWTTESWGASDIPDNLNDIIDTANEMIAAYLDETGDEDATAEYSVTLWDRYCTTGKLEDNAPATRFLFERYYKNADVWQDVFETEAEAIAAADMEWNHLTASEKKKLDAFYIGRISGECDDDDDAAWTPPGLITR